MLEKTKSKGKIEMRINRLREHPKDEILLAYLDGELSHGQMREIRAHLMIAGNAIGTLGT